MYLWTRGRGRESATHGVAAAADRRQGGCSWEGSFSRKGGDYVRHCWIVASSVCQEDEHHDGYFYDDDDEL